MISSEKTQWQGQLQEAETINILLFEDGAQL